MAYQPSTSDIGSTGTITALDAVVAAPTGDGALLSGASTAGSVAAISAGSAECSWMIMVTGSWTGTLYFETSLDSTTGTDGSWVPANGRQAGLTSNDTNLASSTTGNGIWRGNVSGFKWLRARSKGAAHTGTASISFNLSPTTGAVFMNASLPAGSDTIGNVRLTDGTTTVGVRPDGFSRVQIDPTTLLFDTFETIDTTNTWTVGGTAPTGAGGVLTINAASTANATSYAVSKPTFIPGSSAYLQFAALVTIGSTTSTGTNRFWGLGTVTTPTVSVPITNGAIFEVDTTGAFFGSAYSAGARTQTVALTRPSDGLVHRYAIYYKSSRVYFEIDNVIVGSLPFPNPSVAALSTVIGQANAASGITGTNTLTSTLMGVGDTGRNATKLADGLYPWRTATIKPASTAPAAADNSMVVALHPTSVTEGLATYRGRASTFRMLGRGTTAPRRLMTIWNAVGSGKVVHINQVFVDLLQTAVMAVTVVPPVIRIYRITAAPTGGTALIKVAKDTLLTSNANITLLGDASADGTNSTTALAATTTAGTAITEEYAARLITAAGYEPFDREEFLEGKDVVLRPGEGLCLSVDVTLATQDPSSSNWLAGIDWYEV